MVALYKDPQGRNVFKRMEVKTTTTQMSSYGISGSNINTNTVPAAEEDESEVTILKERVTQLEARLKLYEGKKEPVL